ncbi:sulfite exporter TauE/SafE family protein [uncultured Shewanella sp.]|uniref:sulfite exporter TauE/SafE family protein n=1 Tax=uncultured Shewanella sp. TaxID=173975 RepID=UPI0026146807|nr:sulfite exporter TauE/SafE family protein [uncultured Shewanella sp.]
MSLLPTDLSLLNAIILIIASFFTSVLTSAMGIGGGIALLTLMAQLMPISAVVPVHGIVQLGANTGRALLLYRHIHYHLLGYFSLGAILGGLIGAHIYIALPVSTLQLLLGLFILYSIWGPLPQYHLSTHIRGFSALFGAMTTLASIFVGAIGPLVAILIKSLSLNRQAHVATFSTCMVIVNIIKVMTFGLLGFAFHDYLLLMLLMLFTGFIGTWAGQHYLQKISDEKFIKWLNAILTLLAIHLIFQSLKLF